MSTEDIAVFINNNLQVPLNEFIEGLINTSRHKVFTSNTVTPYKLPPWVDMIKVFAVASGANGYNGSIPPSNMGGSGASGGPAGSYVIDRFIPIVPGEELTIVVGAGNTIITGSVSGPLLALAKGSGTAGSPGVQITDGYIGGAGGLGGYIPNAIINSTPGAGGPGGTNLTPCGNPGGNGTGYGSGGGGAGGSYRNSNCFSNGGQGGSGIIIISW